jgi:dipeptidyl aminopeptidase/acylaminoacyl peptidase
VILTNGARLGPYEIIAPLGAGGMGEVYRARDTKLGRDVAVKVLPADLANNPESLSRFEREARAVAALSHPNILAIHDFGRQGETAYAVMELLEGETLRARLEHGALPARKAVELAVQIAEGLGAAHEKGIVHRDLKPENVFVTSQGRAKLLDFGLVKQTSLGGGADSALQTAENQTAAGTILGTVRYMSPEQVRGEAVDHRSDIFSFGVVLHEMLTGQQPFARETAAESMAAILKEDPPEISPTGSGPSPALQRIVQHCLEKKPGERFHDAHDLAFALQSASSPSTESRNPAQPGGRAKLGRALTWSGLLGLILSALFGAWWLGRGFRPQPTFTQVTFRRGNVLRARFTPDGQNIVYSAAWDGRPTEIFLSRLDGSGVRAVGLPGDLMAVNGRGELLILLKPSQWAATSGFSGTLAMASLDGGTPREILARVRGADFAPDGQALAVMYQNGEGGPFYLDYPLGTRLMASSGGDLRTPRISPQGDQVAFSYFTHLQREDVTARGGIAVVDRAGKRRDLATKLDIKDEYLAWSRDGREIYFTARKGVMAVDMQGHLRPVNADSTTPYIHDVSPQGLMLLERELFTRSALVPSGGQNLDLGWDRSSIEGLSRDGSVVLLFEAGGGPSYRNRPFLRRLDPSPPKVLDPGTPLDLNPAGDSALVLPPGDKAKLRMIPTGLGAPRELGLEGWNVVGGRFSMDGKYVYAAARQGAGPIRTLRLPVDGGRGVVLPESVQNVQAISPDGKRLLCLDAKGQPGITSEAGEPPRPLAWNLEPGEAIVAWNAAEEVLLTHPEDAAHMRVEQVELSTGRRTLWQRLVAPDPATTIRMQKVRVSGDGKTLGYTCDRVLVSNLIVAEGLK